MDVLLSYMAVVITFIMWIADRYGWFGLFRKKALRVTGTWRGWSVYQPTQLRSGSNHRDEEHFFKIIVNLTQHFNRVSFTESIEEIHSSNGSKIKNVSARKFSGQGGMVGGVNVAIIFDELEGLTCGTMFLTLDTWGNQLTGAMIVRNVDGKPVVADVLLTRDPNQPPSLEEMIKVEAST